MKRSVKENGVYIIAEAGVNHNGDMDTAVRLVKAAASSGADAVKFQTFRADTLVSREAAAADYQKRNAGVSSQYDMLKRLELSEEDHRILMGVCEENGIQFLSSPFDLMSVDLLVRLGLPVMKIPSGEIRNLPYLRKVAKAGTEIILSSGMSVLSEIEQALYVLYGAGVERESITVLHCNTEYPTPFEHVELKAMLTIQQAFGVRVGYSDHTTGVEIPIAAVALGATVIEKHFTLDRSMEGPDHKASLEPTELKSMVDAIRNVEAALGDGIKRVSPSEAKNIGVARKSIVAARLIKKGELFSEENLTVKRPGGGLDPMRWDEMIGKSAPRDFHADEFVSLC